ncbi:MAG: zf-HC2 domain-containing protein [Polyangia bacterium]
MTCRDFIEFLHEFLDGGLDPSQRAVFEHHLRICPSCVAYLHTYEKTIELGREALAEEAAEDMPEALVTAILAAREQHTS